jgi:predicted Zn finger-like uncharacterized protein
MSYITRCPACTTAFKVVPDQLKISDGWVRCGHCHQVFDATLDLQPWQLGQPPSADASAPMDPPAAEPRSTEPPAEPLPPAAVVDATPASMAQAVPVPPMQPLPEPQEPEPEPAPPPDFQPTLVIEAVADRRAPQVHADHTRAPSFVRQAERRAFWRKPVMRWLLGILLLWLLGLLALQVVLDRRDLIAARDYPAARPALEALCALLDCVIETPLQLDDLVIDSSVLLRRSPGRYSFNVVIRNRAAHAVAMPAIELTLTDLQDQVLVRRVLLPTQWPRPADILDAGAEWSLSFDLALEHASDRAMTGYRALLFYP